jgi:hypothetical protein
MQPRVLGRKASDDSQLCRIHHRLVHHVGNEAAWWKDVGIDPIKAARKFWKRTRLREEPTSDAKEAAATENALEQCCKRSGNVYRDMGVVTNNEREFSRITDLRTDNRLR